MTTSQAESLPRAKNPRHEVSELFRFCCLVRHVEQSLLKLFDEGKLSGTTHTCIGQEAVAAALWATLKPCDILFSTHRCHGHFLAAGGPLRELFAEIMGRDSALCRGRGGSQHLHFGSFFSNGVQGGVVGNATGIALAEKYRSSGSVTVAMLGDGTLGEGLVYESLNFASLRSLPILYLLEHNRYAQSTPSRLAVSGSMTARAAAFGIETAEIETNDALELLPVVQQAFARIRIERRPALLVVHTYRLAPHSKGDDTRDPAEIDQWRQRDPLLLLRAKLPAALADQVEQEARDEVQAAIREAEQRPFPAVCDSGPVPVTPAGEFPLPWAEENTTYVQSINSALLRALERDADCLVMGQDILDPYGGAFKATRGCSTRYPERTITTPISEAGIVAWATGAALGGMRPVAEIMFGDFLALAADQILNHASKYRWMYGGEVAVPLVIRTPMGGRRGYGPTHSQSIEAMFAGVPGLAMVAPTHLLDPGRLLERAIQLVHDPVLFIENKLLYSRRLAAARDGRIGLWFVRGSRSCFPTLHLSLANFEAPAVTIITYGGSVPFAMQAAERLLIEDECLCDIIVPTLLAPLPASEIESFLGAVRHVLVVEEGVRQAGWGAEVVASLAESRRARRYLRIGAPASPLPASKQLEKEFLPDGDRLAEMLKNWLAGEGGDQAHDD